jgi:serine/threonine-protein kinase PpkA
MKRVLVVEDEESIRKNIERMLSLEGFEVATAPNGQHGLVIARSMLPDIIVTDINMPVMDGFAMLDAIRHHPELDRCIVIMLTAADERDSMRRGMRLGADDYLTKPFRREDLLDAINSQLKKLSRIQRDTEQAVAHASAASEQKTLAYFKDRYAESFPNSDFPIMGIGMGSSFGDTSTFDQQKQARGESQAPVPARPPAPQPEVTVMTATVMFADIRNFTTMAERLSASELTSLLQRYFELACKPVVACGGTHLKMLGDGLLALFEERASDGSDALHAHARRAMAAACGVQHAVQSFKDWVEREYGTRGLMPFQVGVGLHSGEVTISMLGTGASQEVTALGDVVNIASRLQVAGKELGWTIASSMDTAQLAGSLIQRGRQEMVQLRGREKAVAACEVLGLQSGGSVTPQPASAQDNEQIKREAEKNSSMTARAAKEALKESLWHLQSGGFESMSQSFKGYKIIRKLGEGGMSDVFLAYSSAQKQEVVLKVLRTSMSNDAEMLRRFIQEYAVLANLTHHHVARIYDQGFTDEFAYIAMEYLSGGTLKEAIRGRGLPGNPLTGELSFVHGRVIDLLRQIVSALDAIHRLGLVYRDLKPENLMFRKENGELVLVDFGIVKNVGEHTTSLLSERLVSTEHGQVVGTPYYVSPEQATGQEVDYRSDFYSLGVMLYEMLTGSRAYRGDSLNELLARHLHAPVPALPEEHRIFQPLLDTLMAKTAAERPANAMAIWSGLEFLVKKLNLAPKARI